MKNEKNQKKKRKLFLALIMILFTGIILTASTYAWFTANQTVTVENIDVNVAASNGLQLSVDGNVWKPYITVDEIKNASTTYAAAQNQIPVTMVPVSTVGETDPSNGFMNMYRGEVIAGDASAGFANLLMATQTVEANGLSGDFIAFDLFMQVNETVPIYLTSGSSVVEKNTTHGIANSSRVGFVVEGNVPIGTQLGTIQALATPETPILWEPNYNAHTDAAVAHALSTYGQVITTNTGPLDYNGVKAPFTTADGIKVDSTDPNYFQLVTPQIRTTSNGIATDGYEPLMTLNAGITKVRIYMWIEGQDVDCENSASGSDLSYNLQFSILDKA